MHLAFTAINKQNETTITNVTEIFQIAPQTTQHRDLSPSRSTGKGVCVLLLGPFISICVCVCVCVCSRTQGSLLSAPVGEAGRRLPQIL